MAIRDHHLNFTRSSDWDLGALAASGTAYAPDAITLPTDTQSWDDIGGGMDLWVALNVVETFTSAGGNAADVRFDVLLADDNAGTNPTRIGETQAFSCADLTVADGAASDVGILLPGVANAVLIALRPLEVDLDGSVLGKFISLKASNTDSVNAFTQGKVQAWLTIGKDTGVQGLKHFHRSGFVV
jgi:hypothetical protein